MSEFADKVVIVTGAGNGLGRSHALAFAERGARVLVNDFGGQRDGSGASQTAADKVVEEIKAKGGEAMADYSNVCNSAEIFQMADKVKSAWGRIDILINNAGILRDTSFSNMTEEDFRTVMDVHVTGSFNCTKAVWETMKEQCFGRIVMTTSNGGLYGSFGQANYSAAKMALVGLMNTLSTEGHKYNIRVNAIAPIAATRMTEDVLPPEVFQMLTLESISAGVLALCREDAPDRYILCTGAGSYSKADIYETNGVHLPPEQQNLEGLLDNWEALNNAEDLKHFTTPSQQGEHFIMQALAGMQGE